MPNLDWNLRVWRDYPWPRDGEEWTEEQALACGTTPQRWKESLVAAFITVNLRPDMTALEIGCGHGRWSLELAKRTRAGWYVDLNQKCVDFTQGLLGGYPGAITMANDGRTLPFIGDASVDFVFSFDTFVHLEEPEVRAYAAELARVMKRQAVGVIHHSGNPTEAQRARGARTAVTAQKFTKLLAERTLVVIHQTDQWGHGNVKLAGDMITAFTKP